MTLKKHSTIKIRTLDTPVGEWASLTSHVVKESITMITEDDIEILKDAASEIETLTALVETEYDAVSDKTSTK